MRLADVLTSIRQHWRMAVVILVVTGAVVGIFLFTRDVTRPAARYRAESQLLVPAISEREGRPEDVPPSLLQGQSREALSDATTAAAYDAAGIPEDARNSIAFGYAESESGNIITLSSTAPDPDTALDTVQTFRDAYIARRQEIVASAAAGAEADALADLATLQQRLAVIEDELAELDPELLSTLVAAPVDEEGDEAGPARVSPRAELQKILLGSEHRAIVAAIRSQQEVYAQNSVESLVPSGFARTIEVLPPTNVTPPLPSALVPIAVILGLGLALAIGAPVALDRLDRSVGDARTAETVFEAPVLSSIPESPRRDRQRLVSPASPRWAAYRTLATTSIATDRLPRAIVVTSPTGETQDSVAANFAAALAAQGLRVALVATDARQAWFVDDRESPAHVTWPEMLDRAHDGSLNGMAPNMLTATSLDNLLVLPPGPEDSSANLNGLAPLLEALSRTDIDVTVIAGPSLLDEPDATLFAWVTRSVLWVCDLDAITVAQAREASNRLALAGASAFGVAVVAE